MNAYPVMTTATKLTQMSLSARSAHIKIRACRTLNYSYTRETKKV